MKDIMKKAGEMLTRNLLDYSADIEKAYLMADDKFKVSLGATFAPEGSGTKVVTEISFTPEKIKDKSTAVVTDSGKQVQRELDFSGSKTKKPTGVVRGMSEGARRRARGYVYH